ncbi:hypothetical protein EIN_345790 [Entamoeba invadens IP1]|uniref:Bacterial surface antigen (D15) domain-containing protein n=1 Tax=Entamoeba invadens IP1 TaxID=370355 RepID=L7FJU3_ENTIV|nr:hypothetical protein EIN_345790 [Entamoeba invadens IP1]ELP83993.1 hypothetical protein EIN_345790 [Entamoeba invadens IP1]|eukprot:XP_004183339.1 hypothetical protein EIN_345790 [Entamoeba invadens IP1]
MINILIRGLPPDTQRHFHNLLSTHSDSVIPTLTQLSVISSSRSVPLLGITQFVPTKPLTLSLGTSVSKDGNFQLNSSISLNNFLSCGVQCKAEILSKYKNGKLSPPQPMISVTLPFSKSDGLHSFNFMSSFDKVKEESPFKHIENTSDVSLEYTAPKYSVGFSQKVHSTKSKPDASLLGIPIELTNSKNVVSNEVYMRNEYIKKTKYGEWTNTFYNVFGVEDKSVYWKPQLSSVFKTITLANCWMTSRLYFGCLVAQSNLSMSEYYYLGSKELRGFRRRGCVGECTDPHLGGDVVGTFHQFVHRQLPFGGNSSIFGFFNCGFLSFKKIKGEKKVDCINSVCGVGISLNGMDFSLIKHLKSGKNDEKCMFQVTTSF